MDAGASSFQNKVYKFLNCGCIYCYDFSNEHIQLLCHCHNCLQNLKKNTFNVNIVRKLVSEISCCEDIKSCKMDWLSQPEAIQEATRVKMRGIDEFLENTNILERYGVKCSKK